MTLQADSRLGPYEIVGPLGAGGMGAVFRARDPRLGRDVAIKLLVTHGDPDGRSRLLREARTVASLNHPHICAVYDVGDADGVPFMAMELVEGETLREAIARGRFSSERIFRIGRQLAEGLAYAHGRGVIHRDIKAANIMVMPNEHAKLMDFGIAVSHAGQAPADLTRSKQADDSLGVAGTLAYMAPELLEGKQADARSDIWSLGVLLYEMTAGRSPFDRKTNSELIAAILRDSPPPLPAGTPTGLARIIERSLAKEPALRPAHAAEIALALEVATPAVSVAAVETASSARKNSRPWLFAVIAICGAIGGWWYFSGATAGGESVIASFANPTQVTTALGVEEFAAWSPDGRTLAFAADASGLASSPTWDIMVVQPGAGAPINLTADFTGRDLFPAWSRDGKQIAFWSERDGGGCYVMPSLGGGARRVAMASLSDPSPPVWSSDGTRLGCVNGELNAVELQFVALQTGQVTSRVKLPGTDRKSYLTMTHDDRLLALVDSTASISSDVKRLWVVEVSTGKSTAITDGRADVASPAWSPDGRILYYVARAGTTMDLWAQPMNADGTTGGARKSITAGIGMRNAALSPDGRRLVYSQGRKVANVWRVPLRAGGVATWTDATQLTFDQAFIECFDLNREGTELVMSSDRSGSLDLWTMPAAGGPLRQLTTDGSAEWCPNWSPDGTTIAFYAYRTGNREVWTIPAAGGEWRQITDNPGVDMHPGWSSDGRQLAFLSQRGTWVGTYAQSLADGSGSMLMPNGSARWSPVDRRVAYRHEGQVIVAPDDGRGPGVVIGRFDIADRYPGAASGRLNWTPDGAAVLFLSADNLSILEAGSDGRRAARTLVDLSGRRGIIGGYGTPTDGKFIYFAWQEDLGDLWMMTADQQN